MLFQGKGVLQVAIRMVGLDLDGTLFNSKKELTAHTCAVLAAAARQGVAVVPATGRPRIGLPQALLTIPGIRYAVVSNGAAVCDLRAGVRLYADCMPSQAAHFYDNEILGYQAQSYRGKSSKKEWWYVAASKNCPDTGRRGPSTISLKNLC